jgi:hypothetical protein|tara:strand:+ start:195 stop:419 length:225 start_codon:yes stop_codon:yes gene_type:complete
VEVVGQETHLPLVLHKEIMVELVWDCYPVTEEALVEVLVVAVAAELMHPEVVVHLQILVVQVVLELLILLVFHL